MFVRIDPLLVVRPIQLPAERVFSGRSGLLGLFYTPVDEDPKPMEVLPEQYMTGDIAEKVVRDIEHWYEIDASVCRIADFDGLRHDGHRQGSAISWIVE